MYIKTYAKHMYNIFIQYGKNMSNINQTCVKYIYENIAKACQTYVKHMSKCVNVCRTISNI